MVTSERAAVALADSSVATEATGRLLIDAVENGAHILHLEPYEDAARVRYRLDGALHEWVHLSGHALAALIAHLKHRAHLLPDEMRWSQEGRFTLKTDGISYTIKLTTLPLAKGEKAVLRIFNTAKQTHSLAELGIWGDTRKRLARALAHNQGMIVVAGSHHGGVSTTLRSALHALNHSSKSIVSLEDPIEHRLPGVHQLRIDRNHGIDMAQGIQTALTNDANIIMISELHGKKAAASALEATAKGRLVLAGMHTSDLASTLQQLAAYSDERTLLAHGLKAVLHQKLVRRLCNNCKVDAKPSADLLKRITSRTNIKIATLQHFMEETAKHQSKSQPMRLFSAHQTGCEQCNFTGYKGRVGLFELLTISSPEMQQRLRGNADPMAILHYAVKDGMMPMLVDGFIKALCGLTTIEEVLHSYKRI